MGKLSRLNSDFNTFIKAKRGKVIFIFVGLIVFYYLGVAPHLTGAVTGSLRYRLFWTDLAPDVSKIKRGSYVRFELHHPLLTNPVTHMAIKEVACIGGDALRVDDHKRYFCNDLALGTAKDKALTGAPIKHFVYNGVVPLDALFVMGHHKDSLDSRYVGFIKRSDVKQIAYPIF